MNLSTREPADQQIADKSGLPSPLKWIVQLLNRLVDTLPSSAKTVVFFILLIYLLIATTIFVVKMIPTDIIEISGSVKAEDGGYFPDADIDINLVGTYLYVTKIIEGDEFYYKWILRIPKSEFPDERRFNFMRYNPREKRLLREGYADISPWELKNAKNVVIKLNRYFREDTTTYSRSLLKRFLGVLVWTGSRFPLNGMHEMIPWDFDQVAAIDSHNGLDGIQEFAGTSQASILGMQDKKSSRKDKVYQQLPPDRIRELMDDYRTAKDPVVQVDIQEQFASTDSLTALILADSLVTELSRGRYVNATDYALLLAESDFLWMFSAGGRYSGTFIESYYSQIINLLQTGSTFERNTFFQFLVELRDPRTVPLLLDRFSQSADEELQLALLDIVGSFAKHPDESLRREIRNRLQAESTGDHSQNVTRDIQRTIQLFERPGK